MVHSFCKALLSIFSVTPLVLALLDTKPLKFDPDDHVQYFDIRIPITQVPAQLTTYTCAPERIPLPMDKVYYAIAFDPLIDNTDVMHHMIMFGCQSQGRSDSTIRPPHQCDGRDSLCRSFVVQWSMGIKESFQTPPGTGFKFGLGSYDTFSLQIHWNNKDLVNDTTDSSGFRVYYTTRPRQSPMGNVQVGQNDLEIPPDSAGLAQTGSCSSSCTRQWLTHPIYLTRAHVHMHYLGTGGVLELVRGSKVIPLLRDEDYNYTSPPAHHFEHPVEVRPGDELRMTCYFNSRDGHNQRNQTIYWGKGADGEMCYAFITYYPLVPQFDQCIQFDKYDVCFGDGMPSYGECVFYGFEKAFRSGMAQEILDKCLGENITSDNINLTNVDLRLTTPAPGSHVADVSRLCSQSCDVAIREVTEHPCMQDRLGLYARRVYLPFIPEWSEVEPLLDRRTATCQG